MLAGVSHDLRTPLTRMRLALEFLEDEPVRRRAEVRRRGRCSAWCRAISISPAAKAARRRASWISRCCSRRWSATARRDGAPVTIAAPEAFAFCRCGRTPSQRCIANLIANARRYGSHVWVTAVPVRDGIDILVDDDGPGIPAAQREDVFRPFFRLDAARNPQSGGVGLGLTIARDVALSHGGEISLEDSPHDGLRVRIHLPK